MVAKARLLLLLATMLCLPASALTSNTTTYISNVDFAPHGAISRWRLAGQKIYEEWGFNSRLQQTSAKTGTALAASDLLELGFGYGTTNNNGNLLTQDIKHPKQAGGTLALQQTYSYDKINRLTNISEAVISGGTAQSLNWNVGYGFDPFGNVFASGGAEAHAAMARAANFYNPATNRQTKYASNGTAMPADAYNTAGDLKNHPEIGQMAYDVEGRLVEHIAGPKTIRYFYDGDGQRIRREQGTAITYYIYGADGALMAEYGATEATETTTSYLHSDHLGSTRLVTKVTVNASNQVEPTARMDYLPYGLEIEGQASKAGRDLVAGFGAVAGGTVKFTGKERDAETGLDYFRARYLSAAQGRFTSPDAPFADQKPEDPQSWNLYSYVRNNPLRYTDPTGRCLYPGADCFQYLVGGAKAVANLPSDAATLLNRGINALTGANIPDAPRFEGANYDQRAGMEAAGFAMLVTPLAEAGAARISSAVSGAARVEASAAAVEGATPKLLAAPKARGNLNTAEGPAKVMVDSKGNAIPLKPGETLTGSPDGRFLQVRDAQGRPTGMRLDGPHKPSTHPDPRAQRPHAHVPGRTNPDGTPWLPVNQ